MVTGSAIPVTAVEAATIILDGVHNECDPSE